MPELTVERVLKQVYGHREIKFMVLNVTNNGKQYIMRDFLFELSKPSTKLLSIIDGSNRDEKGEKAAQREEGLIEIDKNHFRLLQQV